MTQMTLRHLLTEINIMLASDASAADLLVEFEERDSELGESYLVPANVAEARTMPDGTRRLVIARKA